MIRKIILLIAVSVQLSGQDNHFVSKVEDLRDSSFAEWISMPGISGKEYGVYYFRKAFSMDSVPEEFLIHVSADNRYRLFINGNIVSWGPAVGDLQEWFYETVNIGKYLRRGENIIAAQVWNYGSAGPARQISHRTALIVQGDSPDEYPLNTNGSWKVLKDVGYHPLKHSSSEVGGGYIAGLTDSLDGALHPWGWQEPDFDDRDWERAIELGKGNHLGLNTWLGTPWLLKQRRIPPMEQKLESCPRVLRVEGLDLPAESLNREFTFTIPKNSRVKLLLDRGYLSMGFPKISVSKGNGAEIKIRYQEALFDNKNQKVRRNEWQGKKMKGYYDVFLCEGGEQRVYEPLWLRVFRYAEIEIETKDEALEILDFNNLYTAYPFKQMGSFHCDRAQIENIWDISWRTVRLCALESYMDCPYYEQLQYIGDTRIQALISMYVAGDDRLVKNAIQQFYNSMQPMGLTKSNHPSAGTQIIPPFSLLYISMIHDYFMLGSDSDFVREFLPGIGFILEWFISRINENGMTGPLPYWNHIDGGTREFKAGSPPGIEEGNSAHMSILLAYSLNHAAEIFDFFGKAHEAGNYRNIASGLIRASLKNCYDQNRGLIAETPVKKLFSQHTNSMAILAGAFSPEQAKDVAGKMLSDNDLAQATLYFNFYLFQALKKAGLGGEMLNQLQKWEEFIDYGFSTFPEHGIDSRSDCHAWSSHPMYNLLNITCGISSTEACFKRVLIEPQLGDLVRAEGTVTHPSGELTVKYARTSAGKLKCEITLPENVNGNFNWEGESRKLSPGTNTFTVNYR